eukprot:Tbor_TRINITY_DN4417_c0_g1::TRINITY_DN4417_c0_g1_i1::g.8016::m.8016
MYTASTGCPYQFFPIPSIGGSTYNSLDITTVTGRCPPVLFVQFIVMEEQQASSSEVKESRETGEYNTYSYSHVCPGDIELVLANRLRDYLEQSVASLTVRGTSLANTAKASTVSQSGHVPHDSSSNSSNRVHIKNFQFVRGAPPSIPDGCDPSELAHIIKLGSSVPSILQCRDVGDVQHKRRYSISYIGCIFTLDLDPQWRGSSAHGNGTGRSHYITGDSSKAIDHNNNEDMMRVRSSYINDISQVLIAQLNATGTTANTSDHANTLNIPVIAVETAGFINVDIAASLPRVGVLSSCSK